MEFDERLIEFIKSVEGEELKAYKDPAGVLTIGFGHTNATGTFDFDENTVITKEQAEEILIKDLQEANKIVNNLIKNRDLKLNQQQLDLAVAIYFHRPWSLKDGGLEQIATGNIDLVNMDQQEKIKKRAKGASYEQGLLNRVQKEIDFINEFDDPTDESGDVKQPVENVGVGDAALNYYKLLAQITKRARG